MKKQYFAFYQTGDGGERFYFENGAECVVVVRAATEGEAWYKFLGVVDADYFDYAKQFTAESFSSRHDMDFIDYIEWDWDRYRGESSPKHSLRNGFRLDWNAETNKYDFCYY